ncbi:MAG TPA: O-antigen ligase family protein [Longimicrobiaceae bacterium]|nr:O-antigen ligase family protein [Longimicrobiaceae bacterium]
MPGTASPAERIALRVLQLGALAVVLVAATYKLFELDRFFIPKELVLHATALLAGLCMLGAARRGIATRVDALLVGFLALGLVSALLATNPWLAARALAVSVSGVVIFWCARGIRRAGLSRPLLIAIAVAVVLTAATSLAQTYGLETEFFSINRAPGGTLGNRNFIAHVAAFGLPVLLLVTLRARGSFGFVAGAVGVGAVAAAVFLTRSRAAWLALAVVFAVLFLGWLLSRPLRRSGGLFAHFVLLLLFLAAGAAAGFALPNTLHWNSDTPYLETAKSVVNYQEGSGHGRLIQYRNSVRMALHHPVFGVGPGNWPVEYPAYASRHDPSMSGSEPGKTSNPWPSSDWVAFLADRGLPAFVLLVLALVSIAVTGVRQLGRAGDEEEALGALAMLGTLAGVVMVGLFDAALLLAWPTLLVWATLGALWAPELAHGVDTGRGGRVSALLVLTILSGLAAVHSAGEVGAMAIYSHSHGRTALEKAARLDPGNYRVQLRLSRGGNRKSRCAHASAAHSLFPHAEAARAAAERCR